jgi:hypothetical protein
MDELRMAEHRAILRQLDTTLKAIRIGVRYKAPFDWWEKECAVIQEQGRRVRHFRTSSREVVDRGSLAPPTAFAAWLARRRTSGR